MKKSKRLTKVLDVAVDHERDAANDLAESQRELDARRNQLDELRSLHEEYTRQVQAKGENGLDAGTLRDYWSFVDRLSKALTQQRQSVDQSEKLVSSKRDQWWKRRAHAKAMEELVGRHRRHERRRTVRQFEDDAEERNNRRRAGGPHDPAETD